MLGKVLSRCQKHGGVAIVSAGVHLARMLAGVRKAVVFLHGQSIHVGSQTNRAIRRACFDDTDHASSAHAAMDGNAPCGEFVCDDIGCTHFLKT